MDAKVVVAAPLMGREPFSLWSVFNDLKAVVDKPTVERRMTAVFFDDSSRIVNMTEIFPNLFIGDE
jgi:hypothetical protein